MVKNKKIVTKVIAVYLENSLDKGKNGTIKMDRSTPKKEYFQILLNSLAIS